MRTLTVVVAICAISSSAQSTAAESDAQALAAELLVLTNVENNLADMRVHLGQLMTTQLSTMEVPAEQRDKVAAMQQRILDLIFEELTFAKMEPAYVEAYATTFSEEELHGLLDFYRTPAGRAFIDKSPLLTKRIMAISQERMQMLAPRIKKMTEEFVAELGKSAKPGPERERE